MLHRHYSSLELLLGFPVRCEVTSSCRHWKWWSGLQTIKSSVSSWVSFGGGNKSTDNMYCSLLQCRKLQFLWPSPCPSSNLVLWLKNRKILLLLVVPTLHMPFPVGLLLYYQPLKKLQYIWMLSYIFSSSIEVCAIRLQSYPHLME